MAPSWPKAMLPSSSKGIIISRRNPSTGNILNPAPTHTTCPWKGQAGYYTIEVAGKVNEDAAWYYPEPKEAAKNIKNYVAFWKQVEIHLL